MIDGKHICQCSDVNFVRSEFSAVFQKFQFLSLFSQPKQIYFSFQVLAQQYSSDLLQGELERTRLNIACFMESTLQSTSAPAGSKPAAYSSYQAQVPQHAPIQTSSPSFRRQQTGTSSPVVSRRRR